MRVAIVKFRNADMDLLTRLQLLMVGLNGNLNKVKIEELTSLLEKEFNTLLEQKKCLIVRKIIHEWKKKMSSVPNRKYPLGHVDYFTRNLPSIEYEDFLNYFTDQGHQSEEKQYKICIGILSTKIKDQTIKFDLIPDEIFNYDGSITPHEINLIKIMIVKEVKEIIKP